MFKDKPAGLIVDYIGIGQNLKKALKNYTESDQGQTGISEEEAVAVMEEKFELTQQMFAGHDYSAGVEGEPSARLTALANAVDWMLGQQQAAANAVEKKEDKKKELSRFQDLVLALGKAFSLAAASDTARKIKNEIGFFQAVRATIVKPTAKGGLSHRDKEMAIGQLIDKAIANAEIIDILGAAGFDRPDISILSDEFLAEIQRMEQKNLALEALKKLLNGEIKGRAAKNIVEAKAFSERLEASIARYHSNAITSLEMIQELINLSKDLRKSIQRGEELGLSPEELAFYDALSENNSAVDVLGNEQLRIIANVLVEQLQKNVTVDWHIKDSARAKLRILVKRILKKFGYPPDLEENAVSTVIAQAEMLLRWQN